MQYDQYAGNVPATGADVSLSWSVSPYKGYISFSDAVQRLVDDADALSDNQKNKLQVTVNQPAFNSGSLTFSFWRTEYWNHHQDKTCR